jgi:UDP-N-acetylmuramate--alanine ligase
MPPSGSPTKSCGSPAAENNGTDAMKLPPKLGPIHFIGIGGIGMSGIAEVMHNLGYTVQGSDAADNYNVRRLAEKGMTTFIGHEAKNVEAAEIVVVSTAIKRDNPELAAARERRLPVVRRAEMLAELMRFKSCVAVAGTHGKTTTTSLVATLLDAGGLDPTVINGGIINAYGTNARMGAGAWMVVEADESDGTFLKLPADVAIVTNIDPEHLDHFGSFDAIKDAFRSFIDNIPFYGFAVMCIDHPTVQDLVGRIEDRRIITYGENPQADVRLIDVAQGGGQTRFGVLIRDRRPGFRMEIDNLVLPMPGKHNALNATAAIAVAHELGVSPEVIRKAIGGFGGVKRRFTRTGEWNGAAIFDDYGHHPVEIAAVLRAARASTDGQVIAVVQPHRYSRLHSLFDQFCTCFNDADAVIVAPVYAAGEQPIEGADRDGLVAGLKARGHRNAVALERSEDLAALVRGLAGPGDYVVCLGAGNITQWAYALPGELQALGEKAA